MTPNSIQNLKSAFFLCVCLLVSSCAYKFGYVQRDLPGGYKQVSIPVFKNKTPQVAVEAYFTNELINQFSRSQVAEVVDTAQAPVTIEGVIKEINYTGQHQVKCVAGEPCEVNIPENSVLSTEYRVNVDVDIILRRNSDQKVLWTGPFHSEGVYSAPQLALPVINSANPLYNNAARKDILERLAKDMMAEAHDRMTENF